MNKELKVDTSHLTPGFADPVLESRATFRAILDAMAHPGRVVTLDCILDPPSRLAIASSATCLTLLDFETPLWTDLPTGASAISWLQFHCGISIVNDPSEAHFALVTDTSAMPSLTRFNMGTDEYPESSATLIVQVDHLGPENGKRLTGPGIEKFSSIQVSGLPSRFWEERKIQSAVYPLGLDVIFTNECKIAALPRTTIVEG
jgi:alpha-D-ribose 1-methylphosphonate 5-triphosphate synthase subunit PhnH